MTRKEEQDRQLQAFKKLGFTDEEIAEILAADKEIDQNKASMKADKDTKDFRNVHVYEKRKEPVVRERKKDESKIAIIKAIEKTFSNCNPKVTNEQKELFITYKGEEFKIVLSKPRVKK